MKETETVQNRLKAQLPKGTFVAHKTGSSEVNKEGLIAAVNEKIIADISKLLAIIIHKTRNKISRITILLKYFL